MFFTTKGRVFELKAHEVPQGTRTTKGPAVVNFLPLGPSEKISAVHSLDNLAEYTYIVLVTEKGYIKKVDIKDFAKVRQSGIIAIRLKANDELRWTKASTGKDDIEYKVNIIASAHNEKYKWGRWDFPQIKDLHQSKPLVFFEPTTFRASVERAPKLRHGPVKKWQVYYFLSFFYSKMFS